MHWKNLTQQEDGNEVGTLCWWKNVMRGQSIVVPLYIRNPIKNRE
jgi:hypothetical protein